MLFKERKKLKNHFVLGFVSFGSYFEEFIEPFISEIKTLKDKVIMNIQGNKYFVIVSLGNIIADLL